MVTLLLTSGQRISGSTSEIASILASQSQPQYYQRQSNISAKHRESVEYYNILSVLPKDEIISMMRSAALFYLGVVSRKAYYGNKLVDIINASRRHMGLSGAYTTRSSTLESYVKSGNLDIKLVSVWHYWVSTRSPSARIVRHWFENKDAYTSTRTDGGLSSYKPTTRDRG